MSRHIAGLDMGSSKIAVVVGRVENDSMEIAGVGVAPSAGIRKGVIVDMEAATSAMRTAAAEAAAASGVNVRNVYLGISGGHVSCTQGFGTTNISGREVTQADVDAVLESAGTAPVPLEREVLHVMPSDFTLDGQEGIVRPVGMAGLRLEANVRLITALHTAMENAGKCAMRAGLNVQSVAFGGIASAKAVLKPYETAGSVAVIDIGGGTTDIAVFRDGGLCHAASIAVGGSHFTNDLAIGLKISQHEAERVKRASGYAVSLRETSPEIEVEAMDGRLMKVRRVTLGSIILPRCEEVFDLIRERVASVLVKAETSCIVLTGGTALLEGVERVAEAKLGVPVRLGVPEGVHGAGAIVSSPELSAGVGLVLYGRDEEWSELDGFMESLKSGFRGVARAIMHPAGVLRKSAPGIAGQ